MVVPALLLFIDNKERYGARAVPTVLGPFFIQAGDWLLGGFLFALACFVAAHVVNRRGAASARRQGRKAGRWARTGRVLLSIVTWGIMCLTLVRIALDSLFPVEYQRMDPPSADGCTVVVETSTGMRSQAGRIFLLPFGEWELTDTGVSWYYDDGRLIDPEWVLTWNEQNAMLRAPEDLLGFNGERNRVVSIPCG
ncbi:MAG: hypothetical protein ACTMIR_10525 [Cellulomonadaceae bacterium]